MHQTHHTPRAQDMLWKGKKKHSHAWRGGGQRPNVSCVGDKGFVPNTIVEATDQKK